MKSSLLSIILIVFLNSAHAQVNPEITKIGVPIEMLFPEGNINIIPVFTKTFPASVIWCAYLTS